MTIKRAERLLKEIEARETGNLYQQGQAKHELRTKEVLLVEKKLRKEEKGRKRR